MTTQAVGRELIQTPVDRVTVLVDGSRTGGKFTLFEIEIQPGFGSPPHVHSREDEAFFILQGEVEFYLGDAAAGGRRVRAQQGDYIFGPRNVPHNFTNVGLGPLRMLVWVTPAGLEDMFRLAARLPLSSDLSQYATVGAQFGVEFLPPFPESEVLGPDVPLPASAGVRRGAGEFLNVLGEDVWIKATADQTGGAFSFFETRSALGGGTPPHVHTLEDEFFYGLDGQYTITCNGQPHCLGPNEFAMGPVNLPHFFSNTAEAPSRMLVWTVPGGLENFFRDCAQLSSPPAIPEVAEVLGKYGIRLLLPSEG